VVTLLLLVVVVVVLLAAVVLVVTLLPLVLVVVVLLAVVVLLVAVVAVLVVGWLLMMVVVLLLLAAVVLFRAHRAGTTKCRATATSLDTYTPVQAHVRARTGTHAHGRFRPERARKGTTRTLPLQAPWCPKSPSGPKGSSCTERLLMPERLRRARKAPPRTRKLLWARKGPLGPARALAGPKRPIMPEGPLGTEKFFWPL
jgi:hypothetical protein